jgi:hypothetical protein
MADITVIRPRIILQPSVEEGKQASLVFDKISTGR